MKLSVSWRWGFVYGWAVTYVVARFLPEALPLLVIPALLIVAGLALNALLRRAI